MRDPERLEFGAFTAGCTIIGPATKQDEAPEGDEDDLIEMDELTYRLADLEQENYELRLRVEELEEELRPHRMQALFNEAMSQPMESHMKDAMKYMIQPLKFFKTKDEIELEQRNAIKHLGKHPGRLEVVCS